MQFDDWFYHLHLRYINFSNNNNNNNSVNTNNIGTFAIDRLTPFLLYSAEDSISLSKAISTSTGPIPTQLEVVDGRIQFRW